MGGEEVAGRHRGGDCGVMDEPRDLTPVGDGLERMLRALGMPEAIDIAALVDGWAAVGGGPGEAASSENPSSSSSTGALPRRSVST